MEVDPSFIVSEIDRTGATLTAISAARARTVCGDAAAAVGERRANGCTADRRLGRPPD